MSNSDISIEISSLFTNTSICSSFSTIREDFTEVKITYVFDIQKLPVVADHERITSIVNNRDNFHLSVVKDDEVVENFTNRNNGKFEDFLSAINTSLIIGDKIKVIITIEKNKKESILSVYYLDEFVFYLKNLSFLTFLNVIERYLSNEKLILENQVENSTIGIFKTETILLINKNSGTKTETVENEIRKKRVDTAISLCHWDIEKKSLMPEDLYPLVNDEAHPELIEVFQKSCLLYTTMFIFDYIGIKEMRFSYKLNGYKTFGEEIIARKIEDIRIDFNSVTLFYKIYQWIYKGGNTNDKISIARNIISLNYNPQSLRLSKNSFDAILSNYKVYERQNVKQYIEVRNKLSEILIELQGKIDKIVDSFIGDYKKNIITLLSFFISVIAIRVVSKGDFIGGFTNEIVILSYSFLLISLGILIYSRWEFSKRISMFDKHYEQLRERYKELLSENELTKIFEDCNPKNCGTRSFIRQQKKLYTILWIFSIGILFIAITIMCTINNIHQLACFAHKII